MQGYAWSTRESLAEIVSCEDLTLWPGFATPFVSVCRCNCQTYRIIDRFIAADHGPLWV